METKYFPERLCNLEEEMSINKLHYAFVHLDTIVGIAKSWNNFQKRLEVSFSNNLYGYIPEKEISIYPIWKEGGNVAPELYSLVGNTVCVKVTGFDGDIPILSRKANMLEAFDYLKNCKDQIVTSYIRSNMRTAFFMDIGAGIYGMLPVHNYSTSRLDSILDLGHKPGDTLRVEIKDVDYDKQRFLLGYKELFENLGGKFNPNDLISCTILDRVPGTSDGYFCSVNPNTSGIVNVPETLQLKYGQKIIAIVRLSSGEKLKLRFISLSLNK